MIRKVIRVGRRLLTLEQKLDCLLARLPNDEIQYVTINKTHFQVSGHWFWKEFMEKGWEPLTYQLMRRTLSRNSIYVDVGTWVGPTILYAAEIGVKHIYGVEANPLTYQKLQRTIGMNELLAGVRVTHICITDGSADHVGFGGKIGADTSSASSIRGSAWTVPATTLRGYLAASGLEHFDLIKIDIEGAEAFLASDLAYLSTHQNLTILLALHPPMWADVSGVAEELCNALELYTVTDMKGDPLSNIDILNRCRARESFPRWGTAFGNFFEIVLRTKC